MNAIYLLPSLLLFSCILSVLTLNLKELNDIFENADCIKGDLQIEHELHDEVSISTKESNLILTKKADITLSEKSKETPDFLAKVKENIEDDKNVLNLINELAHRHQLDVDYVLIAEEGLPHERSFTVRLSLGEESFEGVGRSIKKAKRAAASQAWSSTQFAKPEPQTRAEIKRNVETLTPTVHLNNIAAKLGMKVEYFTEPAMVLSENSEKHLYYSMDSSKTHGSYLNALNKTGSFLKSQNLETERRGGPYAVRVQLGDESFLGTGWSAQKARHAAAEQALELFKKMSLKDAEECLERGEVCNKLNTKSPISVIHELGTKYQWRVSFDLVSEMGPPHKRVFVMQCKVNDFSTDGEASTKKAAKKLAAEAMIKLLDDVKPWDAINVRDVTQKKKKKTKKIKRLSTLETAAMSVMDTLGMSGVKHQPPQDKKGPKDELLALGKEIGMHIKFSSYQDDESGQFGSLVSMDLYHCYGQDASAKDAEDSAALNAIKFIKDAGLHRVMVPVKKVQEPQIVLVETMKQPAGNHEDDRTKY